MLKSLHLMNFRAFSEFTIDFGESAFLVGPNNAGKSTVIVALRLCEALMRHARVRKSDRVAEDHGRHVPAYPVSLIELTSLRESLRHDFSNEETRLNLRWKSGQSITVVWPPEGANQEPFFWLEKMDGLTCRSPVEVKSAFSLFGVVPILSPLDTDEDLLDEAYVRKNVAGRLSSRHFRNQLRLLLKSGDFSNYLLYCAPWVRDLKLQEPVSQMDDEGMRVNVFFTEEGTRIPKELAWAGDGIQIWLQLLHHLYRVRELSTVVLDEPEVYLHPDLQRRLIQLLDQDGKQVILATHSAELIADVHPKNLVLIDKRIRRGRRIRNDKDLQLLSDTLGTAYNIRLAKALRSRAAIFVEGKELSVLRALARSAGLGDFANEGDVAVIPLGGYSHWGEVAPFHLLSNQLLPEAIKIGVLLDRDYRPDSVIEKVERDLGENGITAHVWRRKEIESYLITASPIARISGAPVTLVEDWLEAITRSMESGVFAQLSAVLIQANAKRGEDVSTTIRLAKEEFDENWQSIIYRLERCPPKLILSRLNSRLQEGGYSAVSNLRLAREHRRGELSTELRETLSLMQSLGVRTTG